MTLWILSIALLLLALAFVAYPFINKKKPADHAALLAANVAVFRDTEKLLNNQLTAGDIDQTQHQNQRGQSRLIFRHHLYLESNDSDPIDSPLIRGKLYRLPRLDADLRSG